MRPFSLRRALALLPLAALTLLGCSSDDPASASASGSGASGSTGAGAGNAGCDAGYVEQDGACVDIDECAVDNGGCGEPPAFVCDNVEGGPPGCHYDPTSDFDALTEGVSTIDFGGALPSALCVWGETAFPVLLDDQHHAVIAAARVGAGKVVHIGHETHLAGALGGPGHSAVLVDNAVRWMDPDGETSIGVEAGLDELAAHLSAEGFAVQTAAADALDGVDVYFATSYIDRSAADLASLASLLERGGGLVTAGHAWYWGYSNDNAAVNYPGNPALRAAGIGVTTMTGASGKYALTGDGLNPLFHAKKALDAFLDHTSGGLSLSLADQNLGAATVDLALDFLPLSYADYFEPAKALAAAIGPVVPTAASPLDPVAEPIRRTIVHLDHKIADETPAAEVVAHPAAADFPGIVAEGAPAISRVVTVDATHAGRDARFGYAGAQADAWRSTGLYLPAGVVAHVSFPAASVGQGLAVQIGAHSDTLWHLDTWPRFPALPRSYAVDTTELDVASAFGGLIYVTVPVGASLGAVDVTIDGAVAAPYYEHGKTSLSAWQSVERHNPGPWAELSSDKLVLTVPTSAIASLDDPSALMDLWDVVLDADADLAGFPHDRPRAERIVIDREISAGWMHSGYPIMAHDASAAEFVSLETLVTSGSWGAFHELGHNHQWLPWVLSGSTEASVNLWSVYVSESVLGLSRDVAHSALDPAARAQRVVDYVAGGANFANDWNVWTALETYLQLQEGFGWAPFSTVFTQYYGDDPALDPSGDPAMADLFALRFGVAANADLGPFFVAWGFPISQAARDQLALLPGWAADPMN